MAINFECCYILNIREAGQAQTWQNAITQICDIPCLTVVFTLGKQKHVIDWGILSAIHESLQLNMPFSVAVGGEVWYIEQYSDIERLLYCLETHRLYLKQGVAYYVGDIERLYSKNVGLSSPTDYRDSSIARASI